MMQLKRTLLTLLLSHLVIVMLILIITCVYILPSTKTYSMRLSGINSIAKLRPRILKHHRGTFTLHAFYKNGDSRDYLRTMYDILNRTKHQHNGLRLAFSTHGSDIGMPTSKTWNIPNPTSGLLGFTFATTICNKISMYGFYPFNKDAKNNPLANHYYETGRFKSVIRHVYNREYALFKDLNRTGAIRLVTSQCSYGNNNTNSVD
ncbi:uncharacterized protein [Amphiura filiformis]|uniref:uncharacterized protein isoform X2 n=1 Tax=Amphiura filiformis TaxID=82378 RepID=UPI003B2285B1